MWFTALVIGDIPSARPWGRALLVCLTFALTGANACARRGGGSTGAEPDQETLVIGPVPVSVDNQSQYNVTVYVIRGTLRQRVGEVPPVSKAKMEVPATYTNDRGGFNLQVRTVGGPAQFVSEQLAPQYGDRLLLTVLGRIVNSTVVFQ